jgi:hypothetical protein
VLIAPDPQVAKVKQYFTHTMQRVRSGLLLKCKPARARTFKSPLSAGLKTLALQRNLARCTAWIQDASTSQSRANDAATCD